MRCSVPQLPVTESVRAAFRDRYRVSEHAVHVLFKLLNSVVFMRDVSCRYLTGRGLFRDRGKWIPTTSSTHPVNTHSLWNRYFLFSLFRSLSIIYLTLILLVANLAKTKWCKKPEKWLKTWQMGTHMRVLSESFPMSTHTTGFRWFSEFFAFLCFGWK